MLCVPCLNLMISDRCLKDLDFVLNLKVLECGTSPGLGGLSKLNWSAEFSNSKRYTCYYIIEGIQIRSSVHGQEEKITENVNEQFRKTFAC